MREQNILKIFQAVRLISRSQGATIKQLMNELNRSRRSINRLMLTLHDIGFPVYDEPDPESREKRWKFEESYLVKLPNIQLPNINLSFSQIIALQLIRGASNIYKGTEIEKELNRAYETINELVPEQLNNGLSRVQKLFLHSNSFKKDYSGKENLIETLAMAMIGQNTLRVEYDSFLQGRTRNFRINPLHFFEHKGGLYIYVIVTRFDDLRSLAVERIIELTETDQKFEYPANFDPHKKLNQAFGVVHDDPIKAKIWFSPQQAPYVKERRLGHGETITENTDGSVTVSLDTSGRWDVKQWVLSWGPDAKVLEPQDLKEDIISDLKRALSNYEIE